MSIKRNLLEIEGGSISNEQCVIQSKSFWRILVQMVNQGANKKDILETYDRSYNDLQQSL